MKKKYIKIVCILCMIWAFSLNANAQWRFGIEGGGGVHTAYHYDYNGFNTGKDNKGRTMYQANFVADYYYLAIGLPIGLLCHYEQG